MNVYAKINATFSKKIGNVANRIVVGTDLKSDGNLGDGKVYDLANPPFRNSIGDNTSPRPRKYSDIPFVTQLSLYAEENMTWSLGERNITLQAGGRFDNVANKRILTPRINASVEIIPNMFYLREAMESQPSSYNIYLYPENAYFDLVLTILSIAL